MTSTFFDCSARGSRQCARLRLIAVPLIAILPTLALAWMPVPERAGGLPLGFGYPPPPVVRRAPCPDGSGLPEWSPVMPPPGPFGPFDATAPMDRPGSGPFPPGSQMRISRHTTDDAYLLDIGLDNIAPDQVRIRPAGQGLMISYSTRMQTSQEDTLPRGEGFRRSYRFARGSANQRVALPPDANSATCPARSPMAISGAHSPRSWPLVGARPVVGSNRVQSMMSCCEWPHSRGYP